MKRRLQALFLSIIPPLMASCPSATHPNDPEDGPAKPFVRETPTFNPMLEWIAETFDAASSPSHSESLSTPLVLHLDDDDGDGSLGPGDVPEIVCAMYSSASPLESDGLLRAFSGEDGALVAVSDRTSHPINGSCYPAAADIDGDGAPEIVAIDPSGCPVAFEADLSWKWTSATAIETTSSPVVTIADLDSDGSPEILVGRSIYTSGGARLRLDSGDSPLHGLNVVGDLDLDGSLEYVTGRTAHRADGTVYWSAASASAGGFSAIADIDGDSDPDVAYVASRQLYILNGGTGAVSVGPVSLRGASGPGGPPLVADLDGDGAVEIGVADGGCYTSFSAQGSIEWEVAVTDLASGKAASSAFDFDLDGVMEICYRDERYLRILSGADGSARFQLELSSMTRIEYPVIADIDSDACAEILVASGLLSGSPTAQTVGLRAFGPGDGSWDDAEGTWNQHSRRAILCGEDCSVPTSISEGEASLASFRTPGSRGWRDGLWNVAVGRVESTGTRARALVLNDSARATDESLAVCFWSGPPGAGGTRIACSWIAGPISAGASAWAEADLSSLGPGTFSIYAVADSTPWGERYREPDEADNAASASLAFK